MLEIYTMKSSRFFESFFDTVDLLEFIFPVNDDYVHNKIERILTLKVLLRKISHWYKGIYNQILDKILPTFNKL